MDVKICNAAINHHITTVGTAIAEEHGFKEDVVNPGQASVSQVMSFGRICSDSDARLNAKSVVLESSRQVGSGSRVTLDLNGVPEFSLFPGQVCSHCITRLCIKITADRVIHSSSS